MLARIKQNIPVRANSKGESITIDQMEVWGGCQLPPEKIDHYTLRSQLAYTVEFPNNEHVGDMVSVRCRE